MIRTPWVPSPYSMAKNKLLNPSLTFLLLVLVRIATGNPQYMVLVPSLLHTETPEKGCLLLTHLNETVTVKASLESIRGNRSLFTDLTVEKDLFHCISFTIPRSSASEEVVFLSVEVKGPTQEFKKKTTVLVKNEESLVFVQTDKPIYKPGQTVKFRVVSLDDNFHPLNELIPLVYLQDPKDNRITQWQNIKLVTGLTQLSFPLSSEPFQGSYKVVVQKESGSRIEHPFTVEEFVLPKFEVQVTMPKIITILEKEINVSVCGIYTYGKPVPGHVTLKVCRNYARPSDCYGEESQALCEKFSQQLDSHGCFSQQLKTKIFQLKRQEYEMTLRGEAKIQEEGTELELTGTGFSDITKIITKLSFVKVDSNFRQGIPFFGQVLLMDGKGVPMPNKLVFIQSNEANYHSNATTDEHGLVQFSINTTSVTGTTLTVRVKHKDHSRSCYGYQWLFEENLEAYHTIYRVFSPSNSYVHLEPIVHSLPCGQTQMFQTHYIMNGQILKDFKELVFYYLIMAKGGIVRTGTHVLPIENGDMTGHFSVSIPVEADIAPTARFLIYTVLPDGEVVGDSATYEVENCLANKVDLSFSPAQSLPASNTHLRVKASPQSLCALRAVDRSVLLLKPEAELSPSSVYNLLPVKDLTGFPQSLNQEEDDGDCVNHHVFLHGIMYSPVPNTNEKDMYSFLQDMGLKAFTNTKIRKPRICPQPEQYTMLAAPGVAYGLRRAQNLMEVEYDTDASESYTETVRKYFPETWIWDLVVLSSSGVAEVEVTVPDTITEWKAGALCLSNDTGLGLSLPATLQAFQPLFVELTMPYSVVRGEAFTLKATVLNYLPNCIRVHVQLEASPEFLAIPVKQEQASHCICGNERQTVSWAITPKSLGNVNFTVSAEALESQELCGTEKTVVPKQGKKDTIIKPLLVEPEGIEKEATFNSLLCPSGAEVSEILSLKVPPNVVKESARASVSVLGDILSSAMHNTQNLLQLPYGCGEQNMVLFAPNIYVMDYLNETQQLTPEIKSKAVGYLIAGYQRQLSYKHHDGSYSTFGEQYGRNEGNTWLTAFVLKTFAQARHYIYVDEQHITQALTWLSQKQKDNGCFRSSGSLLNNAIKGGVDDEVTLSAYVTIALLEIPLPVTHPVVRNALFCLESAWKSAQDGAHGSYVYTKALLAYAFTLAGNQDKRKEVLKSLDEETVKEENSIHWARPQKPKAPMEHFYQPQAPSAEVEMTSYVLLAHVTTQPAPTSEELAAASRVVKWITKQQNSHGGFSSTQDTVVALHALSKYGAATFSRTDKAAQVTIQGSQTFSNTFQVDNNNRLLLQQVSLPEVPGEYSTKVTGDRCVYVQTSLKYNVLPEKEVSPFALKVQTSPQTCDGNKAHTSFQITVNVSYTGSRPVSNMVIADVKMVSGFIPMKPSVKMLERSSHVSRTEVSNNHVLIYLDKVTNQTVSLPFMVMQDIPVKDLKPAIVKVYDYYETDEFAIAEYDAPCSKGKQLALLVNAVSISLARSQISNSIDSALS
ncbi:PREDICTED: alpha-2-macroglobulin-like [Chrysochloris asiatica]|uniref:Alpha-2-macroglobulin n=1 Tax=Chrysochloris asiatica TaxID=185453 RepID=A0A9B0U737_CHRAS|nr:PREDICTED: alpha-2-macroglobulin-like [Chrysochloris asiatica]